MEFKIGDLNDHHPRCTWIDFFHYFGDPRKINGQVKTTSPKFPAMWYLQADMIITVVCVSVILSLEQH